MKTKYQNAFTLIELLVVIAIIGLLASIVLVAVNNVREDARDVNRRADIQQIYKALQMYYDDNNAYPSEGWCDSSVGSCGYACPCNPLEDDWSATSGIYTALIGGGYISKLPIDPINDASYYYNYEPDCNTQGICSGTCCYFRLTARLEQGGSFTLQGE